MATKSINLEKPTDTHPNTPHPDEVTAPESISKQQILSVLRAIPENKTKEMMAELSTAVATETREDVFAIITRWIGIGSFYADPDRETNHPLAHLAGSLKDSPELKRLMERLAKTRRRKAS